MATFVSCYYLLLLLLQLHLLHAQQSYVNNKQLDCETNYTTTLGYLCNSPTTSCSSFLSFRTTPTFNNPASVAKLLGSDASEIARINNISTNTIIPIPIDSLLVVPVNCSCSNNLYQHNVSYLRTMQSDSYFSIANNTFQALTTCQSMIAQNPYDYHNLSVGVNLTIPLRCACPTVNQTAAGFKYLLTYPVKSGDSFTSIANTFNADVNSIPTANELPPDGIFYFFTPLLIPLKTEPININTSSAPSPPTTPAVPSQGGGQDNNSSSKWVFVGVGIGVALLLLSGVLLWYFRCCCQVRSSSPAGEASKNQGVGESTAYTAANTNSKSWSEGLLSLGDAIGSLTVYKFEELTKATNSFGEANRIEGSVYKASFKGDDAAVKVMKGDVTSEINVLKQINHSNIIRLSGFCVHQGNTYLVYEYAQNASLRDWLCSHHNKKSFLFQDSSTTTPTLAWKERVQIACDAADALNYLHNYANPPYIHKNLKSSNILLDANMRAKLVNFGLARAMDNLQNDQEEGGLLMTRHVVGTHGYMAPEYIENGLVTPKLDVFALGVVMLELLSGKEAAPPVTQDGIKQGEVEMMLSEQILEILGGENVREKLHGFMDPCLRQEYPLDLAYAVAQLASICVSPDFNSRPAMAEVFFTLSKILSSSLDWDPSYERENSRSSVQGR